MLERRIKTKKRNKKNKKNPEMPSETPIPCLKRRHAVVYAKSIIKKRIVQSVCDIKHDTENATQKV